ncbi:hypothetical protein ACFLXK_03450 [Chloroflexota bacterium]
MARPRNFEDILSKLTNIKRNGDKVTADCLCPGHKTPQGHLTLKDAGDKALAACQGGRHTYRDIVRALDLDSLTYSNNGIGGSTTIGKVCEPVNTPQKHAQKGLTPTLLTPVNGVNLDTLSKAKNIPVDYLKGLGVRDFKYNGQPAIKIPYYGEDGTEISIRFRLAITGDNRFKWRKGDQALPYGLNRLDQIKKMGWVLIVEGESDCWTCWLHGIPTLGAPGKGIWPVSWGVYLQGLEVYVWQEPEATDFVLRVLNSAPDLRFIGAPDGIKDINEAHVRRFNVPSWLEELKANAKSGQELKAQYTNKQLSQLYQEAKVVIEATDPLKTIENAIRGLGYGGDIKPALITYLAVTSRLLEMRPGAMPVHLLLTGPSSGGKSYTLGIIKTLMPTEGYHVIDAGSPRVLIYDEASLEHKALVFGEADSLPAGEDNPAASAIRNLLQDHHLHYEVTIRDRETGDYQTKRVHKPGPTVLITTSTRPLGDQLMTRFFTLELGDSREQISAALETQAGLETKGIPCPDAGLVDFQAYLQLKAPVKVTVPYATELGAGMAKMASAPRILRDFARLMSLIKAVTLIRHHHRQLDSEGRIVAELADYETVRGLVNDMYVDSSTGATSDIRKLVEAVIILDKKRTDGERFTNTTLAKHLNIGTMQASRRARRALKLGWLVNREQRKYHPADYAPGEPMPEVEGLPVLEGLNTANPVNNEPVSDSSFKNGTVNMLTPFTDGDIPHPPSDDLPDYPAADCPVCGKDAWGVTPDVKRYYCTHCHPEPDNHCLIDMKGKVKGNLLG